MSSRVPRRPTIPLGRLRHSDGDSGRGLMGPGEGLSAGDSGEGLRIKVKSSIHHKLTHKSLVSLSTPCQK